MLNLIRYFLLSIIMLYVVGCSFSDQKKKIYRPMAVNPALYGVKVGQTSEAVIRKKFRILKSSGRFLYLDPKDSNFKNLFVEKVIVLLTKTEL